MRSCMVRFGATFIQYFSIEEDYRDPLDWPPFYIEDYWEVLENYQPTDGEVPYEYQAGVSE